MDVAQILMKYRFFCPVWVMKITKTWTHYVNKPLEAERLLLLLSQGSFRAVTVLNKYYYKYKQDILASAR